MVVVIKITLVFKDCTLVKELNRISQINSKVPPSVFT